MADLHNDYNYINNVIFKDFLDKTQNLKDYEIKKLKKLLIKQNYG